MNYETEPSRANSSPTCPQIGRIQDSLEGLLDRDEAAAFQEHVATCFTCSRERDAFAQVFAELDRTPVWQVDPLLTQRILAAVRPARLYRRWARAFGWTYAGSLAGSAAVLAILISNPGTQAAGERLSASASWFMVQTVSAAFSLLGAATLVIANGWGSMIETVATLAAVPRAFATVLAEPAVLGAIGAAAAISLLMLALIHGRERKRSRRVDPLGLLGV
jgi:hypothetical protein